MAQNVVIGVFEVESEAYQALTELKTTPGSENSFVAQAVLVKSENGMLRTLDRFEIESAKAVNDMAVGTLMGALIGILGGPIGVLLGGTYGALVGSAVGATNAVVDASLIEQIAGKLKEGDLAIIALASEENEEILNNQLAKFNVTTYRYDAAVVAAEVEEAQKIEKEMARQAREELRQNKRDKIRERSDKHREKLDEDLVALKAYRSGNVLS